MDAFYAQVEQLDDPSLRGRPVLVGGRNGRGVVLTASYEARPFGVGSAMPMSRAIRKCPKAIVVPPRFERYMKLSSLIMDAFEDFSPTVEPLSLDEAFLDMTGAEGIFGPPLAIGRKMKDAVRDVTGGLVASVGLSGTKYVAKVAGAIYKPDGLLYVPQEEARAFLAPLHVSKLWGAGPATVPRLEAVGLRTIGQVADADPRWLSDTLGAMGRRFASLARAENPRRGKGSRRGRSMGSERTLAVDVSDPAEIKLHLRRSADAIGQRLRKKGGMLARGVRVKLKTSSFRSVSRQATLRPAANTGAALYQAAVELLDRFEHTEPYRLVGLAAFDFVSERPQQLELFDPDRLAERLRLESTMDAIRKRFGRDAVKRAEDQERPNRGIAVNLDHLDAPLPETST